MFLQVNIFQSLIFLTHFFFLIRNSANFAFLWFYSIMIKENLIKGGVNLSCNFQFGSFLKNNVWQSLPSTFHFLNVRNLLPLDQQTFLLCPPFYRNVKCIQINTEVKHNHWSKIQMQHFHKMFKKLMDSISYVCLRMSPNWKYYSNTWLEFLYQPFLLYVCQSM